jgi:energy-coupling factor transporter ATP-binding protein EcfA2
MLQDFTIRNFRGIQELTLPKLARVNLLVGKNGVGKTTVLEAILLYQRQLVPPELWRLLANRSETALGRSRHSLVSQLFRRTDDGSGAFTIGPSELPRTLQLRQNPDINKNVFPPPTDDDLFEIYVPPAPGLTSYRLPIARPSEVVRDADVKGFVNNVDNFVFGNLIFLDSSSRDEQLGLLWETAKRTWNQDLVVEALRGMFPSIEGVDFLSDGANDTPVVKLSGDDPIPLRRLGEGALRVFLFATALANRPQTLLIDEIENGIHHTAQQGVWRFLLETAQRWDIQVFATTHSEDAIRSLGFAASDFAKTQPSNGNPGMELCRVIRLENFRSKLQAVSFDTEGLEFIAEEHAEVR